MVDAGGVGDLGQRLERRRLGDLEVGRKTHGSPRSAGSAPAYLQASEFAGLVGAYEGAGYASTGLYRPMVDCIMFTKGTPE